MKHIEKEKSYPADVGARGKLFLVLIWFAFLLPNAHWTSFPFVIGHSNLSELALILMPFVYALYPRQSASLYTKKLKYAILGFFLFSIFNNILQKLIYGGSIIEFFRVHRSLIPLYVAMMLIYLGPRVRPRLLLYNLAACLSFSFIISLIFFIFNLDFHPLFPAEISDEAYEIFVKGRLYNVNSGFSFIALFLIVNMIPLRHKLKPKKMASILLMTCTLSIIVNVLNFSRTFLIVSILFFLTVFPFLVKFRYVGYVLILIFTLIFITNYVYKKYDIIKYQIDKRIINPIKEKELLESVYYGTRENMYENYLSLGKKYFFTGVPPEVPFYSTFIRGDYLDIRVTDISFVTVLLRNGFLSLLFYLYFFFLLYRNLWKNKYRKMSNYWSFLIYRTLLVAIPFMIIASFNIDILARHYSVVFISLFLISLTK